MTSAVHCLLVLALHAPAAVPSLEGADEVGAAYDDEHGRFRMVAEENEDSKDPPVERARVSGALLPRVVRAIDPRHAEPPPHEDDAVSRHAARGPPPA